MTQPKTPSPSARPRQRGFVIHTFAALLLVPAAASAQSSTAPEVEKIRMAPGPVPPPPPPGNNAGMAAPMDPNLLNMQQSFRISTQVTQTEGGLSAAVAGRVIATRMAPVRSCYQTQLQRTPTLRGSIELQLSINAQGAVTVVTAVPSSPALRAVGVCMRTAVRNTTFPAPPQGSGKVSVHIVLDPGTSPIAVTPRPRPHPHVRIPSGGRM